MIVIIDTGKGEAYNFKTRKDAGQFIGVSLPTLRGWLTEPFFLHKTLIITSTGNGKLEKGHTAIRKKIYSDMRERAEKADIQRVTDSDRNVRTGNLREVEPPDLERIIKPTL